MKTETATLADGSTIEYIPEVIGEGGEKVVYFSKDKKFVVCLYKDADPGRRQRLDEILGAYNPTAAGQSCADYWRTLFCWPTAIVVKPKLGVVAPVYPDNFFFPKDDPDAFFAGQEKEGGWFVKPKARAMLRSLAPDQLGTLRTNLALVIRLARAVRKLHTAGLAHSDLSYKNVLVDPKTGTAIIIDVDSLVVRGLFPPTVIGTPGFIAPEVLKTQHLKLDDPQRQNPSISTDRHALASLIYQYLLLRDPLDGPKIHDADPNKDELLKLGANALFTEHPTDRSNRSVSLKPTIAALGPYLEPLFIQTFVNGLHVPSERALAHDWEQALVRTFNILVPCVNVSCEAKFFPCWSKAKPVCPFCGARHTVPFPVLVLMKQARQGNWTPECELSCFRGVTIMAHHVFANVHPGENVSEKERIPLATVDFINGQWAMINHGLTSMLSASGNRVQPGQATLLTPGTRVQLSQDPHGRLAEVLWVQP